MFDPYETLQVVPTADIEVIKAAERVLQKQVAREPNREYGMARMRAITDAIEILKDPAKRLQYDANRRSANSGFRPGRLDNSALAALAAIIDNLLLMEGAISATTLRDEMALDGFSNLDYLLAVKELAAKEVIELVLEEGANASAPSYKITQQAWAWIESKRDVIPPRRSKLPKPPPPQAPIVS